MTAETISKIKRENPKAHKTLEELSDNLVFSKSRNRDEDVQYHKGQIWGYAHALNDAGVISRNEMNELFIYYATVRNQGRGKER